MRAAILASGYVTYPNDNLLSNPIDISSYAKYVLIKDYLKSNSQYFYSEEIKYLFDIESKNSNEINSLDNKIRLIKLVKTLFNKNNILDWVRLQKHNPLISISHIDFLKDTLTYLYRDSKRRLDPVLWARLLEPNMVNKDNLVDISGYIDDVIKEFNDIDTMSLNNQITDWFNRPNGYIDMLVTFYIFYGPRDKVFTVV